MAETRGLPGGHCDVKQQEHLMRCSFVLRGDRDGPCAGADAAMCVEGSVSNAVASFEKFRAGQPRPRTTR